VARAFRRVAAGYAKADFLHAELRARLLARLDLVRLHPETILDLGAGPPESTADITGRFPSARLLAVDLVPEMLGTAAQPWLRICADGTRLPLRDNSVDLAIASMLLHWCEDVPAVLTEIRRVLRYPGLVLLTTLGPGSLKELRAAWPQSDRDNRTLAFTDMHNLGDALVRAGFAEPVVDTETLTITYRDLGRLMTDLRGVGAGNLAPGRPRGLTGRTRWNAMADAYEELRSSAGVLPVTLEVIYAQAWSGGGRGAARDGTRDEFEVPIDRLRRRNPDGGVSR
jgi:malonyl-CoA O-methyltransferase